LLQPTPSIVDNQAQVNFVQNKASGSATQLFPIGALTKGRKEDMAELFDMKIVERLPLEL
jgi:dihydroorotase